MGWKTFFQFFVFRFPSGGVGKYLSDWMIDGEPPYDLIECEPGRYGNWTTREYVLAKVRETYGLNNEMMHPKLERWAGRPVRTSRIYKVTGFCSVRTYAIWFRCTRKEGETSREDRPFLYWKLGGVEWIKRWLIDWRWACLLTCHWYDITEFSRIGKDFRHFYQTHSFVCIGGHFFASTTLD